MTCAPVQKKIKIKNGSKRFIGLSKTVSRFLYCYFLLLLEPFLLLMEGHQLKILQLAFVQERSKFQYSSRCFIVKTVLFLNCAFHHTLSVILCAFSLSNATGPTIYAGSSHPLPWSWDEHRKYGYFDRTAIPFNWCRAISRHWWQGRHQTPFSVQINRILRFCVNFSFLRSAH